MNLISDEYRALNAESHVADANWGRGGIAWLEVVKKFLAEFNAKTVLDYGCGKGALVDALNKEEGIIAFGYDPAMPGYDNCAAENSYNYDFLVCLDVLEHIEPALLGNVLAHIRGKSNRCLITIATRKAKHILPDGRNAHLIVENNEWWLERLSYHFDKIEVIPSLRKSELTVLCSNPQ